MEFDEWFDRYLEDGSAPEEARRVAYEAWHGAHNNLPERFYYEREMLRARLEYTVKILTGIHALLPPEDVNMPDGRIMRFHNPDPELANKALRELAKRIKQIPDEIKVAMEAEPKRPTWGE